MVEHQDRHEDPEQDHDEHRGRSGDRHEDLRGIESALRRISSIGRSRDAGRLRAEVAGVHLTTQAAGILSALTTLGPLRSSALAEAVDADAPIVSRELRSLRSEGYVTVEVDPADGRARVVSLTDLGREVYRRFRSATDAITAGAFDAWEDEDLVTLRALLDRVVADFASVRRPERTD